MRYVKFTPENTEIKVDIEEFRQVFRQVHQLAAMKARSEKEDLMFYAALKRSTELLHYIHPGLDAQVDKMLDFAFQYHMTKQEEALDGDPQAMKFVSELRPLFHQSLLSTIHLN